MLSLPYSKPLSILHCLKVKLLDLAFKLLHDVVPSLCTLIGPGSSGKMAHLWPPCPFLLGSVSCLMSFRLFLISAPSCRAQSHVPQVSLADSSSGNIPPFSDLPSLFLLSCWPTLDLHVSQVFLEFLNKHVPQQPLHPPGTSCVSSNLSSPGQSSTR